MFKIASILLALAIVHQTSAFGLNKHWRDLIDYKLWHDKLEKLPLEHNQCVFFRGDSHSKIACTGKTHDGYIECPAHFMFDGLDENVFDSFAIGLHEDNETIATKNSSTLDYFNLYPRLRFSCSYMPNWLTLDKQAVRLSLFHSHEITSLGVHIIEEDCFHSLVKLITSFKHHDNIELKSVGIEKHNATKFAELYIL